uniref:Pentraxin family member n=1 Tax=Xiphophorus couchianus TaxID=32473 RepID=A0A3B5N064_9TELE
MYCVFFLNVFLYQMLLLLLLVASCAAIPQNVSEKMFTFPQETNTAHVRLTTSRQNLQAVTVCFRFFTDLTREYALFSLAVPSFDNGLLFYKNLNSFSVSVKNAEPIFEGLDFKLNKWHSVCGTWSAASGLVQLWLNGEPSSRKLSSTSNINGPIIIALGQVCFKHYKCRNRGAAAVTLLTPHTSLLTFPLNQLSTLCCLGTQKKPLVITKQLPDVMEGNVYFS